MSIWEQQSVLFSQVHIYILQLAFIVISEIAVLVYSDDIFQSDLSSPLLIIIP
jgi:hypothetical protein